MGTLTASLNIALQSMEANQEALSTTTNNIANANTPGYTDQTVAFTEAPPLEYGGLNFGNGVSVAQISSQRDSLLQTRLDQENQQQASYNSYLGTMNQVQSLFNETTGNGLQSSLTAFFNSLQQLSTSPADVTLRQGVLTAAQNLAQNLGSILGGINAVLRTRRCFSGSLETEFLDCGRLDFHGLGNFASRPTLFDLRHCQKKRLAKTRSATTVRRGLSGSNSQ